MFTSFEDIGLTWLLIWTANLCDLGLHIIGYCYWTYLNLFDFCCLDFSWCLDECFGTVLRMGKTKEWLEQLKVEDMAWVGQTEDENFGLKKKMGGRA